MEDNLEDKICLRQFIRPSMYVPIEGVGDCTKCVKDYKNQYCKLYRPIAIGSYTVKE